MMSATAFHGRTRRPLPLAAVLGAALLLWLVAFLSLGSAQAHGALRELVPAYFAPEGSPDPWHTMCEEESPGSTAIVNPNNGPVKREAKGYLAVMSYCHERGENVIGYVYTRYGKRSLKKVEKAINDYYSWYPTIQGIFLDEMAEQPSPKIEAYYQALESYVHERGGLLVGNPGDTAPTAWQLSDVDVVVTFEGSAAHFATYEPASWVLHEKPEQIANIVFAAAGEAQMEAICAQAKGQNAGLIYVTNLPEQPNPYAALPSYFATETARC
jgi:Spherulation-specific family 4